MLHLNYGKKGSDKPVNHSFSVEIAQKYGIEEAIILENIYFWILKNKANKKHEKDGQTWTYNTQVAFTKLFPYMNRSKIQRVMAKLEKEGLINKGNYNVAKYDKTTWYSLTPYGSTLFKLNTRMLDMNNGTFENEQPIPYINTVINTDIDIEKLWALYPNKKGTVIAKKKIPNLLKQYGYEKLEKCIKKYIKEKQAWQAWQMGSTFFTSGYVDYLEVKEDKPVKVLKYIDM